MERWDEADELAKAADSGMGAPIRPQSVPTWMTDLASAAPGASSQVAAEHRSRVRVPQLPPRSTEPLIDARPPPRGGVVDGVGAPAVSFGGARGDGKRAARGAHARGAAADGPAPEGRIGARGAELARPRAPISGSTDASSGGGAGAPQRRRRARRAGAAPDGGSDAPETSGPAAARPTRKAGGERSLTESWESLNFFSKHHLGRRLEARARPGPRSSSPPGSPSDQPARVPRAAPRAAPRRRATRSRASACRRRTACTT